MARIRRVRSILSLLVFIIELQTKTAKRIASVLRAPLIKFSIFKAPPDPISRYIYSACHISHFVNFPFFFVKRRIELPPSSFFYDGADRITTRSSHRESHFRPLLFGWLPKKSGQGIIMLINNIPDKARWKWARPLITRASRNMIKPSNIFLRPICWRFLINNSNSTRLGREIFYWITNWAWNRHDCFFPKPRIISISSN